MPPLPSIARPGLDAPASGAERAWPALAALALVSLTALLGGCGSTPRVGRDGPPPGPPPEASSLVDAEPRIEPLRVGGPNKPYEVLGRSYVPQTRDLPLSETGIASWYGQKFHGRRTANGEVFDMHAMTAAHKTMPLPSYARVRNPANGREVVVRVNDRGPFVEGRIIDLSYAAAVKLGVAGGIAPVEVERLTFEDIRTGAWRRGGSGPAAPGPAAEPAPVVVAAARAPVASRVVSRVTPRVISPMAGLTPSPAPAPASPAVPSVSAAATRDSVPDPTPESGLAFAIALMAGGAESDSGKEPSGAAPEAPRGSPPRSQPASVPPSPPDKPPAPLPVPAATASPAAPPSAATATPAPRGFWIQLGAFRERPGVESFQQRIAAELDWLASRLTVFDEAPLFRLQAGPFASRDEAQLAAQQVREALQLVPLVIERR